MMLYQSIFFNLKPTQFSFIFAFMLVFTGLSGCKKDTLQETRSVTSTEVQNRSENDPPSVTHGMLHFASYRNFEAFIHSLEVREKDLAQTKEAYAKLGIDTDAETIPNLTDHPVCLTTEMEIGSYVSARKSEEMLINDALNKGKDIHSIVLFPHWKTALNSDMAVHIGSRIYKHYDDGGIVIILNDDWALYEEIKNRPFHSLRDAFNMIVTSDARQGWENYFKFNADKTIKSEKPIFLPRFSVKRADDGKLYINNISLIESKANNTTYKWTYSDNTSSTGKNPDKAIGSANLLTLIIDNGEGTKKTFDGIDALLVCSTESFTVTNIGDQIRFELPGFVPGDPSNLYTINWLFSDGSSSTSNPVTKSFTSNGTATCQLLYINNGQLACQSSKPYFANCGEKKSRNESFTFEQCSQRWKLDGSIWITAGEVGCRVKYLRWRGALLGWLPANNQAACADLSGLYIREVFNPNKNCIDVIASGSECLGEGTYPTSVSHTIPEISGVFSKPNQLSAGLGIQVCGIFRGWGHAGKPRLILP